MSTIVVLGGGIGGLSAAFELKDELGDAHEIVLVSDQSNFEFTPSNPWVAVKWRTPEAIRLDLNELMPRHGIRFVGQAVKRVQPESHNLLLENDEQLSYNFLVIASGPRLAFDEIPGLGPHGGYTGSVCKTAHAAMMAEKFEAFCANPGPIATAARQQSDDRHHSDGRRLVLDAREHGLVLHVLHFGDGFAFAALKIDLRRF